MPKINLPKKKEREYKRTNYSSKRNNLAHKLIYNTGTWRKLRLEYLKSNPLCEVCLENEIIKSAIDVHHKTPISAGKDIMEMKTLGFNIKNLKSVCKICHKEEHKNEE